jgi:hypothetical protein
MSNTKVRAGMCSRADRQGGKVLCPPRLRRPSRGRTRTAARPPLLRAQSRPLSRRLKLVVLRVLLAETLHAKRGRRAVRRVRIRVEEGCVRAERARAAARVPKVQPRRGRGRWPAVDRGAALDRVVRVEQAVLERVVARYCRFARELEEVHADEDDDEADEEGYRVHRIVGVEALEENERCDDGGCREANVI